MGMSGAERQRRFRARRIEAGVCVRCGQRLAYRDSFGRLWRNCKPCIEAVRDKREAGR